MCPRVAREGSSTKRQISNGTEHWKLGHLDMPGICNLRFGISYRPMKQSLATLPEAELRTLQDWLGTLQGKARARARARGDRGQTIVSPERSQMPSMPSRGEAKESSEWVYHKATENTEKGQGLGFPPLMGCSKPAVKQFSVASVAPW